MDGSGAPVPDAGYRPWHPHEGWIARRLLVHEAMVAVPSVLAERDLVMDAGGLDETLPFCADYDLELRLAVRAECVVVSEPLVRVRLHPGSRTRGRVEVNESFIRVYQAFAKADGTPEVRRVCRRQQAHYALWVARQRLARGERWKALRALLFILRLRPLDRGLWRAVGGWIRAAGRRGGAATG